MATVTIHSDFGAQEKKICHCLHFFLFYLPGSDGTRWHDLSFFNVEFQASFSLSSFTLITKLFSSWWLSGCHQEDLEVPGCHSLCCIILVKVATGTAQTHREGTQGLPLEGEEAHVCHTGVE